MKEIYVAAALAAAAAVAATSITLAAAPPAAPLTATIVTLSTADAKTFKTWVGTQKTTKVTVPARLSVAVGTVLPMNITLVDIPVTVEVPFITKYKYVLLGDKIVLVDPPSWKIVYIVS